MLSRSSLRVVYCDALVCIHVSGQNILNSMIPINLGGGGHLPSDPRKRLLNFYYRG